MRTGGGLPSDGGDGEVGGWAEKRPMTMGRICDSLTCIWVETALRRLPANARQWTA